MRVLARLGPDLLDRLRRIAGNEHVILPVIAWTAVVAAIGAQAVDAAVIDVAEIEDAEPAAPDATAVDAVGALVDAGVATFVYTTLTSETAGQLRPVIECGVRHYVFRDIDDQATRFRERLEAIRLDGLENRVLAPLLETLIARGAPVGVLAGMRALFRMPVRFRTAEDLARATGFTRSYVNRVLEEASLAPSKTLVHAAHALHAYQFARCPGATAVRVAERLRYTNATTLRRQLRQFTGIPYSDWRDQTPEQCVTAIRHRLGLTGYWTTPASPAATAAALRLVGTSTE